MTNPIEPGLEPGRNDAEMKARRDLSTLYRLVAHLRMTDLIDTHISARVPGTANQFLINRYGVMFHEMTPDDLVKIDIDGNPVEEGDEESQRINSAGFTIHSAIHSARHDLACVIHTHTVDGIAVACQQDGLLPITQHALRYYNRIGYHAYEGIALDLEERERLIRNLGRHDAMILRNHGLLAGGKTIAQAFVNIHFLERACQAQVKAMSGGAGLTFPSPEVCERTAQQFERPGGLEYCERAFVAAQRFL
ncbi:MULTISPECIES: class II aldolase/adducin family protein [unclassified Caballeronia]|jgi:ribulose-5-phosphate 4-epimerase/fuculose-1-phosphate aldolase|uniref:class II aldolase/adducin family protein n=1 Tax=unclassified Caballeronia TaxID=2646786 RepID=UPI003ECD1B4F